MHLGVVVDGIEVQRARGLAALREELVAQAAPAPLARFRLRTLDLHLALRIVHAHKVVVGPCKRCSAVSVPA